MSKLRLEITKGEAIRYISHLDYVRSIERALRRAKLPMAYSEGFNPHMKMSFASALSVGVTSDVEVLEIELKEDLTAEQVVGMLRPQMPVGIQIKGQRAVTGKQHSLMAMINLATYQLTVPLSGGQESQNAGVAAIQAFQAATSVEYVKVSPKGRREIEVKSFVTKLTCQADSAGYFTLSMDIVSTPTGSMKPSEVLQVLIEDFGLPANKNRALIYRTGLYVTSDQGRRSALEL